MIFIVGMGRSGTTMLTNMLNLNSNVIACPENEFVLFTQSIFRNKNFEKESVVDEFINLFNYKFSKVISFWKPKPELKSAIMKLENKSFPNVCKQVYLNYPFANNENKEVTCIVDKNPVYSLYMDDLCKLFPDAKYILLTRDYRDNIASRKKFSDKKNSLYSLATSWSYYYDTIFKSITKNQLEYTLLKYEDLVESPAETLRKLCTFINVDFNEKMLEFQNLSKDIKNYVKQNLAIDDFNKLNAMHENLEKKINSDRVESYKKELTSREVYICDKICYKYADIFNYRPDNNIKSNWYVSLRSFISLIKLKIYYFLYPINYHLQLFIKLYFITKK